MMPSASYEQDNLMRQDFEYRHEYKYPAAGGTKIQTATLGQRHLEVAKHT